jgi:hypothetical protein
VGDSGDDRFAYPSDQTITKAAMQEIVDRANFVHIDRFDPDYVDIVLDNPVTRTLMTTLKTMDRIVSGSFPYIRTRWHPGSIYEEYAFRVFQGSERIFNGSDIFDVRRRLAGSHIPFQNEYFVVVAKETAKPGGAVVWDFEQFGFLTLLQEENANFTFFGYSNNIRDFRFANLDNSFHVVFDDASRTVEVGIFVGEYQDFLGDYWERQYNGNTFDYTVTKTETDSDWIFTFAPIGGAVEVALEWYAASVEVELPGKLSLTNETALTIPKGTIGALRVTGLIGSPKIYNFKINSTLPMVTGVSLEGGTVRLGRDGYMDWYNVPAEDAGDSTSPHKLVVTFDQNIVDPIQLKVQIKGHPIFTRSKVGGIWFWNDFNAFLNDLTLDPSLGDQVSLTTTLGVEFHGNVIKFPFIPAPSSLVGYALGASPGSSGLRMGPEHETPALYQVGAISGCVGGNAHYAVATDGEVVGGDFIWSI